MFRPASLPSLQQVLSLNTVDRILVGSSWFTLKFPAWAGDFESVIFRQLGKSLDSSGRLFFRLVRSQLEMRLLFKVEDVFDITGRGCVFAPVVPDGLDFKIPAEDRTQLRTPTGRLFDTHIASIELLKVRDGPCRMAIMLPRDLTKNDVPVGTEIWHLSEG